MSRKPQKEMGISSRQAETAEVDAVLKKCAPGVAVGFRDQVRGMAATGDLYG